MAVLIQIIGVVIMGLGVLLFVNPGFLEAMVRFWSEGKRLYVAAGIRFAFAVIFFIGASQSRIPEVMLVFAVLSLIGGSMILVMGLERTRQMMQRWTGKPEGMVRLLALFPFAVGALLLYAV